MRVRGTLRPARVLPASVAVRDHPACVRVLPIMPTRWVSASTAIRHYPHWPTLKAEGFTPRGFKFLSFRQRCSWMSPKYKRRCSEQGFRCVDVH